MDFRQLEAFVNVVKYKSFSKAADASFLTQPTISTHVSALEKELNTKLIKRNAKEAIPTEEGKKLYKYAVNLLNTREKAIYAVGSTDHNPQKIQGILEIQTSSIPGEFMVPELMANFRKIHPDIKFYLEQSDTDIVEKNLMEQKGELGFLGYHGSENLHYEKIMTDTSLLITPKSEKFLALQGQALEPEDFIKEPFVWREQGSATRKEFETALSTMGQDPKKLKIVAYVNSMSAIMQSVGHGLGVSVVSKLIVDSNIDCDRFLYFPIKGMELNRTFFLVWNKNAILSPGAEAFKNFVLNFYAHQ